MSLLKSKISVEYQKKRYTIVIIRHLDNELPILLDRIVYKILKQLKNVWYINDKNQIYTINTYEYKGKNYDEYVYMHDLVKRLGDALVKDIKQNSNNSNNINNNNNSNNRKLGEYVKYAMRSEKSKYPIIHINRVNFDNRYDNLEYDIPNKASYVKNTKKKKRTIDLEEYGISVDELPTYVWYVKPDNTHGERFSIEIPGEVSWRSTSSKSLSLKYKLEETKKYLRYLKRRRPDIFDYFCMNGDMSLRGKTLLREYNKMIGLAGYSVQIPDKDNTDKFIQKDISGLRPEEIYVLYNFDPVQNSVDVNKVLKEYNNSIKNK